jgi:putative ABC transport system permease protein
MKRSLRSWLWRVPITQEVEEELAFHAEMRRRELIAKGVAPEVAHQLAERPADLAAVRRACVRIARERDWKMRVAQWIDELSGDIRFATRQLRASPGFTLLAALTLALGIGVNGAIFALVDATLLRPLPFPEPERLMAIWERTPAQARGAVAPLNFRDWNARNRTFESMAAVYGYARRMTGADGRAEEVPAQQVTPGVFELLGVNPVLGRTFVASDVAVPPNIAMLSEGLWRTRFGGDPAILGRVIQIDAQPFTVVGVMPADFQINARAALWTVWADLPTLDNRTNRFMLAIGRLKPGATREGAQSDLERVARDLAAEYPATNKDRSVTVAPLRTAIVNEDLRVTSLLFLGVVSFLLVLCCANVANLLLSRTSARTRELAVRSALGAGRLRIVVQLLTESVVLAGLGGLLGIAVSLLILRLAPSTVPPGVLPPTLTLTFDMRVVWFCAVTALATGIVFGIVPAWQVSGASLVQALASEGRGHTGGASRFRNALVVGEVVAAVVLLCGAGLLLRSIAAIASLDPGHRATEVLTMSPSLDYALPTSMFKDADALRQFFDRVEREIGGLPGVAAAGWGTTLPMMSFSGTRFSIVGDLAGDTGLVTDRQLISPGYLPALGISIVAGRGFTPQDRNGAPLVCLVSQSVVRQYFGGRNPIGMRITIPGSGLGRQLPLEREIVGVVDDVRRTMAEESRAVYLPMAQSPWSFVVLVVRPTSGSAENLATGVRAAIERVDRRVPVPTTRTLDDVFGEITARPRFRAVLVTTFAGLALALTMVGVFGVLAYSVQQRTREFGVRLALGATTSDVLRLVLRTAGQLVGSGLLLGFILAALLTQSLTAFLFQVRPLDPVTFAGVAVVLVLTAALAAVVPALRAARVDPVVAFRNEA